MKNHFPSAVIFVTAISWAGFAIWLGLSPSALLPAFGVEESTPQMLTEVRAFYGGVEMAIAVAMLVFWLRGDLFASLMIGGLPLFGAAICRSLGLLLDGFSNLHAMFAGFEFLGFTFCVAGMWSLKKVSSDGH